MDKTQGLFLPEDENLREKGDWSQFTLWQQGEHLTSWSFCDLMGKGGPSGSASRSLGNPDAQSMIIAS